MDLRSSCSAFVPSFHVWLFLFSKVAFGTTFTFVNKCEYTVWPGILANASSPLAGQHRFQAPPRLIPNVHGSGRLVWSVLGPNRMRLLQLGSGRCLVQDRRLRIGPVRVQWSQSEAAGNAGGVHTLGTGGLDFYDVSLGDGYNLPMIVEASLPTTTWWGLNAIFNIYNKKGAKRVPLPLAYFDSCLPPPDRSSCMFMAVQHISQRIISLMIIIPSNVFG